VDLGRRSERLRDRAGAELNRIRISSRRLSFAFATTLIVLSSIPSAPPAAAAEAVTLTASDTLITALDRITLSGTVTGGAGCVGNRAVQLQFQTPDATVWSLVGAGTTTAEGTYSFTDGQPYTGRYQVELPAYGLCAAVVSNTIDVKVRALVDTAAAARSVDAGSCVRIEVTVTPDKSGQLVQLQRKTGQGWTTVQELTLDAASSAATRPCFGWDDIGIVRLRATWPAQDLLNEPGVGAAPALEVAEAGWMQRIDEVIGRRAVSVSAGDDGITAYEHRDATERIPASNEKLLLSMALLDAVGPGVRIPTIAAARQVKDGLVPGNLWLLGRGDPTVGPGRLRSLARRMRAAGITKVRGRVMGSTSYFRRDWWADGWRVGITHNYVALPTALTYDGNVVRGREIRDPERRAAESMTAQLERLGIKVRGNPGAGRAPHDVAEVARVQSSPLRAILSKMNRPSDNFYAEVLGKLLGVETSGTPGTIAKGAAAIEAFARAHGVAVEAHDGSGLSYLNRVTADGVVRLLWAANEASWGTALRNGLASGGQGTLASRLHDVRLRAKTGSLDGVSALSGWVWLERKDRWGEFSILCSGMAKAQAVVIEDKIVRILSNQARV
jgi:serine-type D-Ala-D-Ala carboxypeptidase/endopeptidase (penicillin-binding protein 4)